MRFLTLAVFLIPFLAFGGFVSSEDASQSMTGVWKSDSVDPETSPTSEQEINITHELVGESIVQSTTERNDGTTAVSDLNNMTQKNTTDNDLSKDNITKLIVENDSALENDTGNKYISKNDGEYPDQGITESTSFDLERTTTVTNVLTNQETGIFPPKGISLEDSSIVQNSGQMVNKTKAESTPTEDSISSNDQSSSNSRNSTPRSGRNGNQHTDSVQPLPLSYKNKQIFSGQQKSLIKDYLFSDTPKSIDLLRILKLILEKETLDLDSKILDLIQAAASDGSINRNFIHNIIALCLKSKGLSARVYDLPRNWYNQPIPLLQPDVLPKAAFAEYLVSVEQPIESTWLPVGSNIDTPMLDTRDRKAFETDLIDIYETEVNPLTEISSNNPSRIDHLRPCWKTQRNCFYLGDKILCKSKVICKPSVIEDKGPVKESDVYNLHNTVSNLEDGIPNLDSGILSLKTLIPLLKNLIPFLKNNIPLLQNVIPILKNALLLRKDQIYKYVGYVDEMDGIEALLRLLIEVEDEVQNQIKVNNVINYESVSAKVLSDNISQAVMTKPGILESEGSPAEITPGTIAVLPINGSIPTYAIPINDGNPMFDTNTIDDSTRRFSTSKPDNTTVGLNPASDTLNSPDKLLNNLNNLNTLNSFINARSASTKVDHGDNIEGNKDETLRSKESVQRALTSEPITGGSDTLPTLSLSTEPLSVSMNQSVLNEITPTLKSAEPVESGPVATAQQSETIYPSVGQLVSLSNQSNEGSVSNSEANSRRATAANSLVNQEYQSPNFETKVGDISTNVDRILNTNLNSDLNINAISKINNILNAAGMNSSGISVDNSLEGIRQSLTTKPESTNSQHVRLNLNQDSSVNINQDENVSKLERGSIEQPMQEPIKMQLPVSSQAEHQSQMPRNTGIAGWNAKQDGSVNENRKPNTNVNQNVNTNQVNIAGLTRGLNPMLASPDMSVNSSNDINRIIPDGDSNMVGNVGLSRRANSEVGFQGQQISEGQTLAQGVSVGDAVAANTNLNYNSNVNSDYNANLRQGDSLKMPESIKDIPTPTQSSEPVAVVQTGGKINTNPHNNNGVDSNFRAHANFKLNLGSGFGIIRNMLTKNPILSGGIISRRIMNLTPKDQNLQGNVTNQNQNENQNLNLNQTENLHENQNPYQSQNQSLKQIKNSTEYSNQNLNQNRDANLDQNGNQYRSQNHVSNQLPNQNEILHQNPFLNHNQNMNQYLNQDRNLNQNSNQGEKIQNSNQYSNQNLNAGLNQKVNQTQNEKRDQPQEQNAINFQNQNSNPDKNQNLNQIDIQSQNQILNQLPKQEQVQQQSQLNQDQYSNQNLFKDQIQNQKQVQNQISDQYLSQNESVNLNLKQNLNQNSNDNGYQNQIQNQNQIKQQNTNQYLSQNQNVNNNVSQDQHSNQNLNQELNQTINPHLNQNQFLDQIQNQNQFHKRNANQYLNQNQNVNQNLDQDLNQNLNTKQNLNSNDSEYQNLIQAQNQINQPNTNQYLSQGHNSIQHLSQNLNQSLNFKETQGLNQSYKQYQNEIQIQGQSKNETENQHFSQNEHQNAKPIINDNPNLNQIENLNVNQDIRRNLNTNQNLDPNQYQKQVQNQIQSQNSNEYQDSNQNRNQNQNQFLSKIQNQYLKQDLIKNFTQNQNSNQNLVQNVNDNQIQTSGVNIPDKIEEKQKGWYELWYNEGEGKDDWTEIWNNKMFKRIRRETNHHFY